VNFASLLLLTTSVLAGGIGAVHSAGTAQTYVPKNGFVPDKETAIRIAETVLIPIYGEKQIASERPFSAETEGWCLDCEWTLGVGERRSRGDPDFEEDVRDCFCDSWQMKRPASENGKGKTAISDFRFEM
jgi:hypothetical protein